MNIRKILLVVLASIFLFGASIKSNELKAFNNQTITGNVAPEGKVYIYFEGQGITKEKQIILDEINRIRQEAFHEGLVKEYVEIKWSKELEKITEIRAVEASIRQDHARPNGSDIPFGVTSNGVSSYGENLAWNFESDANTIMKSIQQFYDEKADYLLKLKGQPHDQTGHYEALINPDYNYTALSAYKINGARYSTTAQAFSPLQGFDETQIGVTQPSHGVIEVIDENINYEVVGGSQVVAGESITLDLMARFNTWNRFPAGFDHFIIPLEGKVRSATWSSSANAIATVDNGVVTGHGNGQVTISAVVNGKTFTKVIDVVGVTSVENVPMVTTESGTYPNLPQTVKATWSNQSQTDEQVHWDAVSEDDYTSMVEKTITVTGRIDKYDQPIQVQVLIKAPRVTKALDAARVETEFRVKPVLPTTTEVVWSNGRKTVEQVVWSEMNPQDYNQTPNRTFKVSGTVLGQTVFVEVFVREAVANIATLNDIRVPSGTTPTLPATVEVRWSNNQVTQETITWNPLNDADFSSIQGGKVTVTGTVLSQPISVNVIVEPATILNINYEKTVTVESGTYPVLPKVASVEYSNREVVEKTITWNQVPENVYKSRSATSATVTGSIDGISTAAEVTVHVVAAVIKEVRLNPTEVVTAYKQQPVLPVNATVVYSNGDEVEEPIQWDAIDSALLQHRQGHRFELYGTVLGRRVTLQVVVNPDQITAIAPFADITVESGVKPVLPKKAQITWAAGDVTEADVTWNDVPEEFYLAKEGRTFVVEGRVANQQVSVKVIVKPATIVQVEALAMVVTPSGTKPVLPKTAKVLWSNAEVVDEVITWNAIPESLYKNRAGGHFEAVGRVLGNNEIKVQVQVTPAVVEQIEHVEEIRVANGIKPTLPTNAQVRWSNQESETHTITWQDVPEAIYKNRKGASTIVNGRIDALNVNTAIKVIVEPASFTVGNVDVTVLHGLPVHLPTTVEITWSNNDKETLAITVEEIKSNVYPLDQATSFTLMATITELNHQFPIRVHVKPLKSDPHKINVKVLNGNADVSSTLVVKKIEEKLGTSTLENSDLYDIVVADQNGNSVNFVGNAEVYLPIEAGRVVEKAYYVDDANNTQEVPYVIVGNFAKLSVTHFSKYGITYKPKVVNPNLNKPSITVQPNTPESKPFIKPNVVKTQDSTSIGFYVMVLSMSVACLFVVKKQKESH